MQHPTYPDRDYQFGQQVQALRAASGLTQSGLAEWLGVSRQAVVGWEDGATYPSLQHLRHLIELFVQRRAFNPGQEAEEVRSLWQGARQRVRLDEDWLAQLLESSPDAPVAPSPAGPRMDWGDAPEAAGFCGREYELGVLTDWLLARRCRVVGLLGMGGIGKTSLAAKLVQQAAGGYERVYWRGLREAPLPMLSVPVVFEPRV